jgi:dTMP kinase
VTRARLISIEGLDGAGKTTLAGALGAALVSRGVPTEVLREPGGVAASERLREFVTDPQMRIGARAEALLYAAARAQLVEERLRPTLERGSWVVIDRFLDSSLAYQGAGRGLGIASVRAINMFGTGGLLPDRTLLLRIDPVIGGQRQLLRRQLPDRLEREDRSFFEAIAEAYEALASSEPRRFRIIDATADPDRVLADALAAVEDLLPDAGSAPVHAEPAVQSVPRQP